MSDFKFMDDVVDDICKSMREDPNRWLISTYLVEDKVGGIKYWKGYNSGGIDSIWTGHTTEKVFSDEQAYKILEAFEELREIKESQTQRKILDSFRPTPVFTLLPVVEKSKKWWEFWK